MEYKKKFTKHNGHRPDRAQEKYRGEPDENVIFGRNAVKELLASGRDIEKLFIQNGDREGSVNLLLGIASERKIPIIEADRSKLDSLCLGAHHQGVVAIAAERNYASIDDIFAYAEEKGEKPFIIILDAFRREYLFLSLCQ